MLYIQPKSMSPSLAGARSVASTTEINAVANDSLGYKKFLNQFRSFTHACNIEGIKCGFFDAKLENKKLFGAIFLLIPIVLLGSGIALESMYKITVPFAYYVSIPVSTFSRVRKTIFEYLPTGNHGVNILSKQELEHIFTNGLNTPISKPKVETSENVSLTEKERSAMRFYGGEVDGISRQLARYVHKTVKT